MLAMGYLLAWKLDFAAPLSTAKDTMLPLRPVARRAPSVDAKARERTPLNGGGQQHDADLTSMIS